MKFHRTKVAAATALTIISLGVQAQSTAAKPELTTVVVTGIRASLEASIEAKKNADTNIEVVTAEDVGKMPDKNIADTLSRLPGVNVQFGGALAMDEAERVAIRGTSPNLNLVTINGHALSSGDWHVGDQSGSGRSVGFGLLPSQLIGQSIVYKTGRADITEGGIAGAVDIIMRKPLSMKQGISGEVAIGAVYATLPNTVDPQVSGLVSWRNDESTLGFLVQAFKEDRHLRRDGEEVFSYGTISAAQATASGDATLAGKRMPGSLNSAMFEGVRKRTGGYLGVQGKPTKDLEVNVSMFQAKLAADNYNSSAYALPTTLVANGWLIKNAKVQGDVIVSADIVRPPFIAGNSAAAQADLNKRVMGMEFDHNLREGATSLSAFNDVDFKYTFSDALSAKMRIGNTEGSGVTNAQPSLTLGLVNPNMSYTINGSRPTDYALKDLNGTPIDLSKMSSYSLITGSGAAVESKDKENYLHLDFDYKPEGAAFSNVKFGLRSAKHVRSYDVVAPRWIAQDTATAPISPAPFGPALLGGNQLVNSSTLPVYTNGTLTSQPVTVPNIVPTSAIPVPATLYPGNYASGIDANFPRNLLRFDPAQLQAYANTYMYLDPVKGKAWASGYEVTEKNDAAYMMAEFESGSKLSGNVGLRYAETDLASLSYQNISTSSPVICAALVPCATPGAIVGSFSGTFLPRLVTNKTSALLPSLNLRYELQKNVIGRLGMSRTLGRANYNELAGAVTLNNALLTGSSGNPYLKPTTSENVDATVAWYFAPRAYVSAGFFAQSLTNYVKAGSSQVEYFNTFSGQNAIYTVASRVGVGAQIRGAEAAFEMPIGAGFGVGANTTYVKSEDADGMALTGTSKWTHNLRGFYEDEKITASLAWNYRTDYPTVVLGSGKQVTLTDSTGGTSVVDNLRYYKGYGSVSLSLGYRFSKATSIHFDGNNLTDPVRSTYDLTENAPGYWHQSGRQYFINLRHKF